MTEASIQKQEQGIVAAIINHLNEKGFEYEAVVGKTGILAFKFSEELVGEKDGKADFYIQQDGTVILPSTEKKPMDEKELAVFVEKIIRYRKLKQELGDLESDIKAPA